LCVCVCVCMCVCVCVCMRVCVHIYVRAHTCMKIPRGDIVANKTVAYIESPYKMSIDLNLKTFATNFV